MPDLDLNFGDVEPPKPLPDGTYEFSVAKIEVKDTKGSDGTKKYLNFQFNCVDDNVENLAKVPPVFDIASLEPNARWKVQQVLEAITGQFWREDGMNLDLEDLLGERVTLTVTTDSYNGQPRNKVAKYHGGPDGEPGD